jgi:hypothetical protein
LKHREPLHWVCLQHQPSIFDHIKRGDLDPIPTLFGDCMDAKRYDWIKQFFTEVYPQGLQRRRPSGENLLNELQYMVLKHSFTFDMFEWIIQQNPRTLTYQDPFERSAFHSICLAFAAIPPKSPVEGEGFPVDEVARAIKYVGERYPNVMLLKDETCRESTPLLILCHGLENMFYKKRAWRMPDLADYFTFYFDTHVEKLVETIKHILSNFPQTARMQNNIGLLPLETLSDACKEEPVQDLIVAMLKALWTSHSFRTRNAFAHHVYPLIRKEARYGRMSVRIQRAKATITKSPPQGVALCNETREAYCLWADKQLKKISTKIKRIRGVELAKKKKSFKP